jgi:hypothetical protein
MAEIERRRCCVPAKPDPAYRLVSIRHAGRCEWYDDRHSGKHVFAHAFEQAKHSYIRVLRSGVDRPDVELAHDQHYRQLLRAGQRILRIGGTAAVCAASRCLSGSTENAAEGHFARLWDGLLPHRGT